MARGSSFFLIVNDLGSVCVNYKNAPIGLKYDRNDQDNIVNDLFVLRRSSKAKGQLKVRFSNRSDWAQI